MTNSETPNEDHVGVVIRVLINDDEKVFSFGGTAENSEPLSLASALIEAVADQAQGWIGSVEKESDR